MVYIIKYTVVDVHSIYIVRIEHNNHEVEFRKIIFEKFARNKKNMLPRDIYNKTSDTLKLIYIFTNL